MDGPTGKATGYYNHHRFILSDLPLSLRTSFLLLAPKQLRVPILVLPVRLEVLAFIAFSASSSASFAFFFALEETLELEVDVARDLLDADDILDPASDRFST